METMYCVTKKGLLNDISSELKTYVWKVRKWNFNFSSEFVYLVMPQKGITKQTLFRYFERASYIIERFLQKSKWLR